MHKLKKFWKSILWLSIITVLLLLPANRLPKANRLNIEHIDLIIHFFLFLFLQLLLLIDAKSAGLHTLRQHSFLIVFAITYGLLSELFQSLFVFTRHGSWWDVAANLCGAIAGFLIFHFYTKIRARYFSRKQ